MKRILFLILIAMLLNGCVLFSSGNVKRTFPTAPTELTMSCPELKILPEETVLLSEVISGVTKNYSQYHDCMAKVNSWIEWYNIQNTIFKEVR